MKKLLTGTLSELEVKAKNSSSNAADKYSTTNKGIAMNMTQRIKRIFDMDTMEPKDQSPQKIIYNEHIYFNPSKDDRDSEMTQVIKNVLKNKAAVTAAATAKNIDSNGKNIYQVNLNINNNYYGSNFNINYGSQSNPLVKPITSAPTSQTAMSATATVVLTDNDREEEDRVSVVKSIPVKGGTVKKDSNSNIITRQSSNSSANPSVVKKKKSQTNANQLSVPCLNCGDLIDMDDVENHSNICLKVKEEVIESMKEEVNIESFNGKLKKLEECICKKKKSENKDAHYYVSLSEYINNAASLNEVNEQTLSSLKRCLLNLDIFIEAFRGSYATLLSIERARVLINEKYLFCKEERIKSNKVKKDWLSKEKKSSSSKAIEELHKAKLKMLQERDRLRQEKLAMIKVVNSQIKSRDYDSNDLKSPRYGSESVKSISVTSLNQIDKFDLEDSQAGGNNEDTDGENDLYLNPKLVKSGNLKISEINSDIESRKTIDQGDATSVSASENSGDEGMTLEAKPKQNTNNSLSAKHKAFVQIFLKVKFEKIHNSNNAQLVEANEIFKEALKKKIPQEDWREFILEELKHPHVYIERAKLEKELKKRKQAGLKITNEVLDIINESKDHEECFEKE